MQEKHLYDYAVIRVLPRVERDEFINVGVILYCRSLDFLRASCAVNEARLASFAGDADLTEVREHLGSLWHICSGSEDSGPIGKMSLGERFRWLTAPRSTVVQTSPVHTGFTSDPEATLKKLVEQLVD